MVASVRSAGETHFFLIAKAPFMNRSLSLGIIGYLPDETYLAEPQGFLKITKRGKNKSDRGSRLVMPSCLTYGLLQARFP